MSIVLAIASLNATTLLYALIIAILGGAVTIVVMIIKNWCKLLSGTYAVMHGNEQRRADARLVYERALDGDAGRNGDPPQVERPPLPPDQRPPRRSPVPRRAR